jgi:hypothetical protein
MRGFMNARGLGSMVIRALCVTAGCAGVLVGFAGVAQAGECPNEALRAEASSTQLPECRAYELVNPVYTAGAGVSWGIAGGGSAPDGEAVQFGSTGGFSGAGSNYAVGWYIARRVAGMGWKTSWVGLPSTLIQGVAEGTNISFDLTKDLVHEHGSSELKDNLFVSDDLDVAPVFSFTEVSGFKEIPGWRTNKGEVGAYENVGEDEGATPNFSHVVIERNPKENETTLYELAGVGGPGPEPPPQVVNIAPGSKESRLPGESNLGGKQTAGGLGSEFHAISNDGADIFFTNGGTSYVRVNGSRTLALGGLFLGASDIGAKVFVSGEAGKLYMDAIDSEPGHEAVTKKALLTPGAPATYLRSSDDGSRVYFDSTGVFASNENENEEIAEVGKENLYVYDTVTEKAAFIAQAAPGTSPFGGGESEAQVNGCPSGELGEPEDPGCEAGRFFVFATTARITPDDAGGGQQVFEYDAGSGFHPPTLARVSLGEGGYGENVGGAVGAASIAAPVYRTDTSAKSEELAEDNTRAVSDDGSTVVFTSVRALSPRAVNGLADIYEYHEGRVGLISTGQSLTPDTGSGLQPTIAPSGRDIFFFTSEGILKDTGGLTSLYDARVGGGFPKALVEAGGCTGDSCQGPPSVPDLLGAPASATFMGLGNQAPSPPAAAVKSKTKPKQCKKGYAKKKKKCVREQKSKKSAKVNGRVKS